MTRPPSHKANVFEALKEQRVASVRAAPSLTAGSITVSPILSNTAPYHK